jgi:hypothetical protein
MHRSPGEESQDAGACFSLVLPDSRHVLLAAVADGAGSMPRSREGARRAVSASLAMLVRVIRRNGADVSRVAAGMGNALRAARAAIRAAAEQERREFGEFACTLVMTVGLDEGVVTGQVGDGGAVVWCHGGIPELALWPFKGQFVNETAFVTDDSAIGDLRVLARHCEPAGIALFTDGLEPVALDFQREAAHPGFFQPLFDQLSGPDAGHPGESLDEELGDWLSEERFDAMSPDDRTLILAVRSHAGANAPLPDGRAP